MKTKGKNNQRIKAMIQYKVWIDIEAIDEENDHYQEIEEPQEAGCFPSEQDARHYVDNLLYKGNDPYRGLHIDPPPNEKDLWRVVYVIDVNATEAKTAAWEAYETMIDPDSRAPVFHMIDPQGNQTTLDLAQEEPL